MMWPGRCVTSPGPDNTYMGGAVSIERTKYGTWQVRWRDGKGNQRARNLPGSGRSVTRVLKSPMRGVRAPKVPKQEMRFLSADELERLANSIDPRYRSLILVAGWGGLRWGELAGLRVGDVDHEGGRVNVTGQLSTDGRRRTETKTKATRTVDLPASVMRELPRNDRATSHEGDSDAQMRGYVWTQPSGTPLNHSNFRQRFFVPAVTAAGLAPLRIHDLRHTSVALAIAAGAHPAEIQAQLGHTSIKTTLDEYGHRFPSQAREVAERLETVRTAARRLRAV